MRHELDICRRYMGETMEAHLPLDVQQLFADRVRVGRAAIMRNGEEPQLLQVNLCV